MNLLNFQANLSANFLALGCALITFWASRPPPAFGQADDESFNAEPTGIAYGLAVRPANKIVIGGDVGLRRLNPDGTLDEGFNPVEIDEAIGAGAGSTAIARALGGIRRGDADSLNGNGDAAVQHFLYAWRQAIRLD